MGCNNGQARREVIAVLDEISKYRADGFTILETHVALKGRGLITCQKTAFYKWVRKFEACDPETYPTHTSSKDLLPKKPEALARSEKETQVSASSTSTVVKPKLPTYED